MDRHSRTVLEFDKICGFLESFAVSSGGKSLCRNLEPVTSLSDASVLLKETTEMKAEIETGGPLPLSGVYDIRHAVSQSLIRDFYLEQSRLMRIKDTLDTAHALKSYFAAHNEAAPHIYSGIHRIIPLKDITSLIDKSISPRGEIRDSASPELAEIRSRIKKLRLSILSTLQDQIHDDIISHAFQDDFITLRNNRYVVPVRSDSKGLVDGVVHDQSQTKATFFIEPMSVVNLNNELQILHKEQYYEEIRILKNITGQISLRAEDILTNLDVLERIDMIHAKAQFSRALDAAEPILADTGLIDMKQCRHPILLSRFIEPEADGQGEAGGQSAQAQGCWVFDRPDVVPIDLIKTQSTAALVISGANAGGKTVAMKTLGLFALMAQAGLHIPALKNSTVSVYKKIFAAIGDEQAIETNLSTFTAHMMHIKTIVNTADSASLVLLDELCSGTDPMEGGGLSVAVLDHLRSRSCATVITTHFNILKTYAFEHEDVENVSVAFDPATHRPTYRLVYGVPGISNACSIARDIGIPGTIIERAQKYIPESDKQIAEMVRGLESTRRDMYHDRSILKKTLQEAEQLQSAALRLLETMKSRHRKIMDRFEDNARALLRESKNELRGIIKEQKKKRRLIRPEVESPDEDYGQNALDRVQEKLHSRFPRRPLKAGGADRLEVGQMVAVPHLHQQGTVTAVDEKAKRAEVSVGRMRIKTGFKELVPAGSGSAPKQPQAAPRPAAEQKKTPAAPAAGYKQINVIGMRVDEALPVVDKTIDQALVAGADTIEIIHGKGTGRLMNGIHTHLKKHAAVGDFSPGEKTAGGAGVTVVRLR